MSEPRLSLPNAGPHRPAARWRAASALALAATLAGCGAVDYYAQSVGGHFSLLGAARPVAEWIADPATPPALRERLQLSQRIRNYAVTTLALPENASYRRYADLRRPAAVWNVVAAPELGLELKRWCYPVVGCVGYRGYFDRSEADREAAALRAEGLEASVYAVPAYSTLGLLPGSYFADPLLSTFIALPEGELARLIFHELAHQVAYASDDTVFNESFATAVEQIGAQRWLAEEAGAAAREAYAVYDARRRRFRELTSGYRQRLSALYAGTATDADKRAAKAALYAQLRADYERVKAQEWGGYKGYDHWFAGANNAAFGVLAAYNLAVPEFERIHRERGGDFTRFYAEVRRLAALPASERRSALGLPQPDALPAAPARPDAPTSASAARP